MRLISILYIGLFFFLGEVTKTTFNLSVPGSILGMALIFGALKLKWIRLEQVKPASDVLLKYLSLFFVPYGVGMIVHYQMFSKYWIFILVALVISTSLSMYITAHLFQKMKKK